MNVTSKVVCILLLASGLPGYVDSAPLFESDEMLSVVIEAPMQDLSRQRHRRPEFPGKFRYADASGATHEFAVIVSTRGNSRLDLCDYPQLRITFDPNETKGTLFEGQIKLKLVRQCLRGRKGQDWLLLEYGIYRAYNIVTDYSFRVRNLTVTYSDSESSGRDRTQVAFFLEDDTAVAKRLNRERIRPPQVKLAQMTPVETTHNVLFQYLIGNTDFAVRKGPKAEGCCHNGRVIAETGKQEDWVVLPYDFDYAGIINTDYAMPGEGLPLRQVTTRLYRGFCWQNELLPDSIRLLNEKRSEIETALLPSDVSAGKSRRVKSYIQRFYKIVNDPEELKDRLTDKCRLPGSNPLRESLVSPDHVKRPDSG